MKVSYLTIFKVLLRLGINNICIYVVYRLKLKLGIFNQTTPICKPISGPLFCHTNLRPLKFSNKFDRGYIDRADRLLSGKYFFFNSYLCQVGSPPRWRQLNECCHDIHWSAIKIDQTFGDDVKKTWELSRFYWMPELAAAYAFSKDQKYVKAINNWFSDWSNTNAPNTGVNWVCAQEVSIRLINVLNTAYLLGISNATPTDTLINVISSHCRRIYPSISYAIAQQNNHGISEASALIIGGIWLQKHANDRELILFAKKCSKRGLLVLEDLIKKLVLPDGGFAMASFAYHRVVLDTLSILEFWRGELNFPKLSKNSYSKVCSLVKFLYAVHDLASGDVPNVGANDGSRSYLLTNSDFRDFRPTLQISSGYFCESQAFNHDNIRWYTASLPKNIKPNWPQYSQAFEQSGFAKLTHNTIDSWGLIRFPSFNFRPSQSDVMHFDLWAKGRNILSDSGSFSYNCTPKEESYFSGAAGHNVVQFDNRESMPRIGKFLWGEWLKAEGLSKIELWEKENTWNCAFSDYKGSKHRRLISQSIDGWSVVDEISNYKEAKIRWHLEDDVWHISGNTVVSNDITLTIISDGQYSMEIVRGWKSLYYCKKSEIPVLEISIFSDNTTLTTKINCQ